MKKTAVAAAVSLVLSPVLLAGAAGITFGTYEARACISDDTGVDTSAVRAEVQRVLDEADDNGGISIPGLADPIEQIPNAITIQATGEAMGIPPRGQAIALATAMQESSLRNISYGDRDSLGLFQQRPSQGWGSAEQIMDPVYAATRFYQGLQEIPGWEEMPLTEAAQAVQRSAYPDAYARWEVLAVALQRAIAEVLSEDAAALPADSGFCPADGVPGPGDAPVVIRPVAGELPDNYTVPTDAPSEVRTAISWALGQLGTPYQWGGTCMDPHGADPMGRCDCSSLMQQAYAAAGISITRTTYTQVREGTDVPVTRVQPGDLLFTQPGPDGPGHVGMAIGSGLVVHAPATGDVVRIAVFEDWRPQIVAVRRIAG
ncbi:C40 family peptidase [Streptomyces carpaticus]|uniref:C40 family peptidase n=1 Tax=Streptomyces carpaticus TaxID=285558 RepID=UPI0021FAF6D7|nr:C40 family peptidase [Streptomyces carpaticus]